MTVMCELHSMLKELRLASERARTGDLWTSLMSPDSVPTPLETFGASVDEIDKQAEIGLKSTPKKSGHRTLSSHGGGPFGTPSSAHKPKPSPSGDQISSDLEKKISTTGLGSTTTVGSKEPESLEDSPPPPPPSESGSLSGSSIPPPPPNVPSKANSAASSPLPPPPLDPDESHIPGSESSPPPSIQSVSASAEPEDVATYVSAPLDRDSKRRPTATVPPIPSTTTTHTDKTKSPAKQAHGSTAAAPPTSSAKQSTNAPKLVVHELPHSFTKITKDAIEESPQPESSALSKLLGPTDVEVWIPGMKTKIPIRILPSATMHQLITQTIKAWNSTASGDKRLDSNPEAYNVRVATPDGQIEELFPVLARKGLLDQWSEVGFILVENPNYKPTANVSSHDKEVSSSSQASSSASAPVDPDKFTVRVTLPTGAYHTVRAEPSMKLKQLLALICEKRKMIASHYTLTTMDREYLSHGTKIQDLKDLHLVLEAKAAENPLGPPSAEEIFYNGNVAAQYRLFQNIMFHVRNKKKFGTGNSKQEMVSLGIDGTSFTITFTKRPGTTFAYAISDLKSVALVEDNPFTFTIETHKERDKLLFEASSAALALDITTKVGLLIDQTVKDGAKD